MATAAQKRRLLEGVAYIRTHRDEWDQDYWAIAKPGHCGTIACLAGHIAITLNPSKQVIPIPWKLWAKPAEERTDAERNKVNNATRWLDTVIAVPDDGEDARVEVIDGKEVKVVHVRERAARLIGGETVVTLKNGDENFLFDDGQTLNTIYAHCSVVTGLNRVELLAELDRIEKAKGWSKKKVSA